MCCCRWSLCAEGKKKAERRRKEKLPVDISMSEGANHEEQTGSVDGPDPRSTDSKTSPPDETKSSDQGVWTELRSEARFCLLQKINLRVSSLWTVSESELRPAKRLKIIEEPDRTAPPTTPRSVLLSVLKKKNLSRDHETNRTPSVVQR